jgi:hypothetical protein
MIGVGQNRFLTGWNQADDNHPLSSAKTAQNDAIQPD